MTDSITNLWRTSPSHNDELFGIVLAEHQIEDHNRRLEEAKNRLHIAAHHNDALIVKGSVIATTTIAAERIVESETVEQVALVEPTIHNPPEAVTDVILGGSLLLMAGGLMARAHVAIQRADLNAQAGEFYQNEPYYGKDSA